MWTCFWDMHSGGGKKEQWSMIYIEAPEEEAKVIFYNRFGHNPEHVTCKCCGEDYSIDEWESLEDATGFHRGCTYDRSLNKYIDKPNLGAYPKYQTLDEYLKSDDVLAISADEIKDEERVGEVFDEGYV